MLASRDNATATLISARIFAGSMVTAQLHKCGNEDEPYCRLMHSGHSPTPPPKRPQSFACSPSLSFVRSDRPRRSPRWRRGSWLLQIRPNRPVATRPRPRRGGGALHRQDDASGCHCRVGGPDKASRSVRIICALLSPEPLHSLRSYAFPSWNVVGDLICQKIAETGIAADHDVCHGNRPCGTPMPIGQGSAS